MYNIIIVTLLDKIQFDKIQKHICCLLYHSVIFKFNLGYVGRLQNASNIKDIYFIRFVVWVKPETPCISQIEFYN